MKIGLTNQSPAGWAPGTGAYWIDVQLFDTYGHEIIRQPIKANESFDVSQLLSGVYVLRTIIDGEVLIHKIIKQ